MNPLAAQKWQRRKSKLKGRLTSQYRMKRVTPDGNYHSTAQIAKCGTTLSPPRPAWPIGDAEKKHPKFRPGRKRSIPRSQIEAKHPGSRRRPPSLASKGQSSSVFPLKGFSDKHRHRLHRSNSAHEAQRSSVLGASLSPGSGYG